MDLISPWESLRQFGLPNIRWCEAHTHGWIAEPANTWSNLIYIILGLVLLWRQRKNAIISDGLIGSSLVFLGCASFVYHMSFTFILQIGDFVGMFMLLGYCVAFNLKRAGGRRNIHLIAWGLVFLFFIPFSIMRLYGIAYQSLIPLFVILLLVTEWKARKFDPLPLKKFWLGLSLIGISFICTISDAKRWWCMPESMLQGHAFWHLFSALAIFMLADYYSPSRANKT
jgi:hypothetical protein